MLLMLTKTSSVVVSEMAELQQFANFESIEKQMEYIPHTKLDKFKMCCKKLTATVIFALGFGAILFGVISLQVDSKLKLMKQETREKLNESQKGFNESREFLESKIETLSAEIKILRNKSTTLVNESAIEELTENLNDKLKALNNSIILEAVKNPVQNSTWILFSAYANTQGSVQGDVTYDVTLLNEGQAFNKHTGIFLCPQDGTYGFSFSAPRETSTMHAYVFINERKDIYLDDHGNGDNVVSYTWSANLQVGDRVKIQVEDGALKAQGQDKIFFHGYLMK